MSEPLSGFSRPRGKGGVSIIWSSQWRGKIKKLEVGNERIAATELSTDKKLCSVYLPTNNTSVDLHLEYRECVDILHDIIMKY